MPETFHPLQWKNDQAPALNDNNLNRIEVGIEAIDDRAHRLELGVATVVDIPYATSITLNATQGSVFRCTATGDLTLDDIFGGVDGQMVTLLIEASGGARTVAFTGSADSVQIPAGVWWVRRFAYHQLTDTWVMH